MGGYFRPAAAVVSMSVEGAPRRDCQQPRSAECRARPWPARGVEAGATPPLSGVRSGAAEKVPETGGGKSGKSEETSIVLPKSPSGALGGRNDGGWSGSSSRQEKAFHFSRNRKCPLFFSCCEPGSLLVLPQESVRLARGPTRSVRRFQQRCGFVRTSACSVGPMHRDPTIPAGFGGVVSRTVDFWIRFSCMVGRRHAWELVEVLFGLWEASAAGMFASARS